ncbi:HEAT repeat domain-containing protein, partial [Coleofasciculus sp. H7-2]|uniref:HEAT repeat domain-containing protein n=1 Tax=Coleofasciculus sp. H7-2 TaxID=3351545 RepID=UPI00366ED64D
PWLKQRAQTDDNSDVRRAAVQELARGWKEDTGMFEFLCDRALNDSFNREYDFEFEGNPRQTALEAIIKNYPDHPQTLTLLQDSAENDPDDKVKEFAKKKLAELDR